MMIMNHIMLPRKLSVGMAWIGNSIYNNSANTIANSNNNNNKRCWSSIYSTLWANKCIYHRYIPMAVCCKARSSFTSLYSATALHEVTMSYYKLTYSISDHTTHIVRNAHNEWMPESVDRRDCNVCINLNANTSILDHHNNNNAMASL